MFSKVLNPTERGALKDEEREHKTPPFLSKRLFLFHRQNADEEKSKDEKECV
jgi:hypothetical protein